MEKNVVSEEVKEAYLNNLSYSAVSKKDWKKITKKLPNAGYEDYVCDNLEKWITGITTTIAFLLMLTLLLTGAVKDSGTFILFGVLTPIIYTLLVFIWDDGLNLNDRIRDLVENHYGYLEKYQQANKSFMLQLENDEKPRYYSQWYLELINPNVLTNRGTYVKFLSLAFHRNKGYFSIYREAQTPMEHILNIDSSKFLSNSRHKDRFNWRNTLSTNRPLSFKEFKDLEKNKQKYKDYLELEKDIRAFQDYNDFKLKENKHEKENIK